MPPGLEGIRKLASRFGVFNTSAAIRFAKLDIGNCVIIKWDHDGYGWKRPSQFGYAKGWKKTIKEPVKLIANSATEKIFAGVVNSAGIVSIGTTASHWFPFDFAGSSRDLILREEAAPD